MSAAPLTAAGVLAHAVHLGLILLGVCGVVALLAPGWRASRADRRRVTSALSHDDRMDALRASVVDPRTPGVLAAETSNPLPRAAVEPR